MQRIGWRRLEVEALVEGARLFVLGVNQNRTRAYLVCRPRRPSERILEQSCPEALPLLALIHGQAGKEDHGDGVSGKALPDPLGRSLAFNAAGRESVVADHSTIPVDDEHASAAGPMTHQGVSVEPVRQFKLAAVEVGRVVSAGERLDTGERLHF